jgi:hypothetical protein
MKAHEKYGFFDCINPSTPLWHHESRRHREDLMGRIKTPPPTAPVLFP